MSEPAALSLARHTFCILILYMHICDRDLESFELTGASLPRRNLASDPRLLLPPAARLTRCASDEALLLGTRTAARTARPLARGGSASGPRTAASLLGPTSTLFPALPLSRARALSRSALHDGIQLSLSGAAS